MQWGLWTELEVETQRKWVSQSNTARDGQKWDPDGMFVWLKSLALAVVSAFNQGLYLPAVTGGARSCLTCRFISGVPFSEKLHDFQDHKREIHPESGKFSRSIWVNLIKANVRKIVCVCVCVCVCVNFPSVMICLQFLLSPYWLIPTWY